MYVLGQEKIGIAAHGNQTINTAAGTVQSAIVSMQGKRQVTVEVIAGTIGAADLVITLNQGNTSAMGSSKLLKTITVAAAAPPSDKAVKMSVRGSEMDVDNDFSWVQLDLVHDEATGGPVAWALLLTDGIDEPQSEYGDAASVINAPIS